MNWKRIIGASTGILVIVAGAFLFTKGCSQDVSEQNNDDVLKEIIEAKNLVKEVGAKNRALRDSVEMWRDSTDFYKKGLKDCQDSKKGNKKVTPTPARQNPVKNKITPQPVNSGKNATDINLVDGSKNNKNIIVHNESQNNSETSITLDHSVNDGNIIVNNGGTLNINDNQFVIDSLRNEVDGLKQQKDVSASAYSRVVVKTQKRYYRTR